MDEADPDRLLVVAKLLVEVQRVPAVVRPDSDVLLGQGLGDPRRGDPIDVDEEGRHSAFHPRQSIDAHGLRDAVARKR